MKDFTKEEIIEINLSLAKFLGWVEPSEDWLDGWFGTRNRPTERKFRPKEIENMPRLILSEDNPHEVYFNSFMRYHNSWDWIKRVIDKIGTLDIDHEPLSNVSLYSSIGEVYKEVAEFVKWYENK